MELNLNPDQWWNDGRGGVLRMHVARVEPGVDEDGTATWATVEGWRVLDGGRWWARELVQVSALPWRGGQGGDG